MVPPFHLSVACRDDIWKDGWPALYLVVVLLFYLLLILQSKQYPPKVWPKHDTFAVSPTAREICWQKEKKLGGN